MSGRDRIDRGITIAGFLVIVIWMCILAVYQHNADGKQVVADSDVVPIAAEGTLSGYEEEVDLIMYMLCQIENKNLDYGLRGCAAGELAEYFSMTSYVQYTEQYPDLGLIPPADYGSPAYEAISIARLTNDYVVKLDQVFQTLGSYGHLELLSVEEDVPGNPDGKYYEERQQICEILGARSVREMRLQVQTDEGPVMMRWTLVRYRRYWKLLLFSPLEEYSSEDIRVTDIQTDEVILQNVEEKGTDILPCNYHFVNDCSEEDPEELVNRFILYLQKQDVWSALTYYQLYEEVPKAEEAYFQRLNQAALEIQQWLYKMFLPAEEQKEWYMREMQERAESLLEELSTAQIIYVLFGGYEVLENDGSRLVCRIGYWYDGYFGWMYFNMVYQDGWKIVNIGV